jgi:hypothetical protein
MSVIEATGFHPSLSRPAGMGVASVAVFSRMVHFFRRTFSFYAMSFFTVESIMDMRGGAWRLTVFLFGCERVSG